MKSFKTPQEVEMWLEYNSPRLSDEQYAHLTPDLKKKYIALGMNLSSTMIKSSEPEVIRYYVGKKIEKLKQTNVNNLSTEDIALLNTPMLKKLKEDMKEKFVKDLVINGTKVEIEYPNGNASKFVALYGFDELFETLPNNITNFLFNNKSKDDFNLSLPPSIGRFKNLEALLLMKCVKSIPEEIGELKNLSFLALPDNPSLVEIPNSILTLPNLMFVNLKGSENVNTTEEFKQRFNNEGSGFYTKKL